MNTDFSFEQTSIEGVWVITPFLRDDNRGSFIKDYNEEVFRHNGIEYLVRETFYSFSKENTVRGLHFQREKQMPKLVRCISGSIYDVAVDLRADSKTFRSSVGFELSSENNLSLLVPAGCAHGFFALTDALVSYKCAEVFMPETDDGIRWNDPDLGIKWPVTDSGNVIISEKDAALQSFADFASRYQSL